MEQHTTSSQSNSELLLESKHAEFSESHLELILDSPVRQRSIPGIYEKKEFSIWAESDHREFKGKVYPRFHEYVGSPEVVPENLLDDIQIESALERLKAIMETHKIYINRFTDVSNRQFYKFITEEFLNMEVTGEKILLPWKFIYEEFYPTDEYLIKKGTSAFFRGMFGLDMWQYSWKNWKRVLNNYKQVKSFITRFEGFEETELTFDKIVIHENDATVYFQVKFVAIDSDGIFIKRYEGSGEGQLFRTTKSWCLNHVKFPGLEE